MKCFYHVDLDGKASAFNFNMNNEQITLSSGDANSLTKLDIYYKKNLKVNSRTVELPEPDFNEISHLISDKPLQFSQRRFLD